MWKENKTLALKLGLKMSRKTSKKMLSFKFICQNKYSETEIPTNRPNSFDNLQFFSNKYRFIVNLNRIIESLLFAHILKNGFNSENITNRINITNNWHSHQTC